MFKNIGGVNIFKKEPTVKDVLVTAKNLLTKAMSRDIPEVKVKDTENMTLHAIGKIKDTDTYVFLMVVGTEDANFVRELTDKVNRPFGMSTKQYR